MKAPERRGPRSPEGGAPVPDDDRAFQEGWLIRLYIVGMTAVARRALENLREICREHLDEEPEIEVIDLADRPQLAADEQIFAVPTAVRRLPEPVRKVIGDLSDTEKALVGLDIRTRSDAP